MPSDPDSAASPEGSGEPDGLEVREGPGGREIVVPMALYKTVTVFSTLAAVVGVVLGFVLLDAATLRVSVLRAVVAGVLSAVGLAPPPALLDGLLAVLGLATIAFGAAVYVVGTRFRARGMGKSQEESAEP